MIYEEKYENCILMARIAHYIMAALENDDYNKELYAKVDRLIASLDSNKKAIGFIGPKSCNNFLLKVILKLRKKYSSFDSICFKLLYTNKPKTAYQEWCKAIEEAKFTEHEIEEIVKTSGINNFEYDELGAKAWRMLV